MRLLAIDIGAGTQDILLFDTSTSIENSVQLIMPAPTRIVAGRIQEATRRGEPLLLTGVTMGGGASGSAVRKHLAAGLPVYATPEAAATLDDDLDLVAGWGVNLVSEGEAEHVDGACRVEMKDLDLVAISRALGAFGVEASFDAVAVAALDHGAAPKDMSDRLFRFQYLRRVVEKRNELIAFVYMAEEVPSHLTRLQAIAKTLDRELPLLLLDTGVAAALGALEDETVSRHPHRLLVNLGNSHTLAFHLEGNSILGLFEHHTGGLDAQRLGAFLERLTQGRLTQEEVFGDGGHGSVVLGRASRAPFMTVTGPRRGMVRNSDLNPYLAAPHGAMMLVGCFGLIRAFALKMGTWREEIDRALGD
ncbi:MAG: DUF1786 domain-containing protein [Dehalococcoidia bacterium]